MTPKKPAGFEIINKLFNDPETGTVTAHNIFGKNQKIRIKDLKLRAGVYGVYKEKGKILLQRHPIYKTFSLPGGGIEMGEKICEALIREFEEEAGIKVKIKRLIDVRDDFFFHEDFKVQSILIFYEVEKIGGSYLTKSNHDDSEGVRFVSKDELKDMGLSKVFLDVLLES